MPMARGPTHTGTDIHVVRYIIRFARYQREKQTSPTDHHHAIDHPHPQLAHMRPPLTNFSIDPTRPLGLGHVLSGRRTSLGTLRVAPGLRRR